MHSIISASVSPLVIKPFHSSTHTENTLSLNPKSHLVTIFTSKSLDFDNINLFKPGQVRWGLLSPWSSVSLHEEPCSSRP